MLVEKRGTSPLKRKLKEESYPQKGVVIHTISVLIHRKEEED